MARARHADPLACLHRLLDRHEDRAAAVGPPEGDAPAAGPASVLAEFVNQGFPDVREETEFRRVILAAEASGAVRLEMDRGDLSHVMKRVVLTDPARLCAFLSRTPRVSQVDGVRGRLAAGISDLPPGPPQAHAREALERLAAAWSRGEPRHRLELGSEAEALRFLRAWGWASTKSETDDRDLRSYSRQVAGDSKLIERQLGRILAEARETGLLPLELETDEAVAALGLGKFPHLVQIGIDAGAHAAAYRNGHHVGIHPGELKALPRQRLAYLMTVENYASFNRMIREVRDPAAAILYTGGWPAPGVRRVIAALAPLADQVLHWGDIDMAGAAIADCVWRAAGREIGLHLMSPDLARRRGGAERARPISVRPESPAASLVAWLSGPDAHVMEQEDLDPLSPLARAATLDQSVADPVPDRVTTPTKATLTEAVSATDLDIFPAGPGDAIEAPAAMTVRDRR